MGGCSYQNLFLVERTPVSDTGNQRTFSSSAYKRNTAFFLHEKWESSLKRTFFTFFQFFIIFIKFAHKILFDL